jgi:CBS domain containing-hemolysin-like protein
MIWQILVVLVLVGANGFFVAAEFALVKVRLTEIETPETDPGGATSLALHMLGHLDAYLSACQLGITLASLGLGWAGEPMVASMLEPAFAALGLPEEKVHFLAFPIAFMTITFLHLTVGEQAPKIGAIQKARATTLFIAYPLKVFYTVFKPFIWLINASSNGMLRLVGLAPVSEHDQAITEDEVRMILTQSAAMGHLHARERRIMENVLDLEDKIARRFMVPRHQIVYLNKSDSMEKKLEIASKSGHTRFPLCDGDLDEVVGIIHLKDVFNAMTLHGDLETLVQVAREALFLPETARLDSIMKEFQKSKRHMAIIVDEYGAVSGMITLENIIEEMVGPIEDEFDAESPLVTRTKAGRVEVDATCSIGEFVKECGVNVPEEIQADSVGGILVETLGRIPKAGEKVRLGDHLLTVLAMERRRVLRVLVEQDPQAEVASNEGTDPAE